MNYYISKPEDLKVSQIGSSLLPTQGNSLSRSKKTLSNYLRLLFLEIVIYRSMPEGFYRVQSPGFPRRSSVEETRHSDLSSACSIHQDRCVLTDQLSSGFASSSKTKTKKKKKMKCTLILASGFFHRQNEVYSNFS